ncbi:MULTISPECIES: IS1380 family transposase [Methylococcus]|uniref:IS1380 family transposase n=1 Tax=Methylococcus capsulatus TaxID=414 RepID=A0ABZ2F3D4_METCP|nr:MULTISPECIES: IS1380 family transposase [Methylococcus]MDF9392785.1 IS1380 family transposase [Methylococcus capsulatus]
MARFDLKQSTKLQLTSYAGLALIGQCCQAAQVETVIDPKLPVSQGMRTSDVVKAMVGLLTLGKSDFEAIEPFRRDSFFKEALGLSKVPGSVWTRQRLDAKAAQLREWTDELSLRLLSRTDAPITPHEGFVCLDLDTFVMNNDGSKKEAVGRTYQGVDGYTPIAAYLGNEGWNIGLELRPGVQHSALETEYFLERIFPRAERLVAPDQAVRVRDDSGFDSARLLFAKAEEKARWAALGRSFDFITKWNPRKQDKEAWVARAEAHDAFTETRPGKRVALLSVAVERAWGKAQRGFRLIVRVTERTIDKRGQHLWVPDIELEGWWTSLDRPADEVIGLYKHHGTHEQFHSEIKSDLDLERLPSGKFDTNDCLLHLAAFAYNCLRLLGQLGLTGEIAPIRHPAKRRRIKTVLQEIMYRAAKFVAHARKLVLDFGRGVAAHVDVFMQLQTRLQAVLSG